MTGLIDFHSHILPGVDDGSKTVAQSIAMLQKEAEQGITRVVATPHFYPRHDTPDRFLKRRYDAEMRLREAMEACPGLPEVIVGAEVYFFPGISESDVLSQLTIGENRSILIEMPMSSWTDGMYRELEDLALRRGFTPVIAHVDRYISPLRTHGIPKRLARLPVLVQANAEFFLHRSTAAMALRMLKQDQIHLLGSDCHDLDTRAPNLGAAANYIENRLGSDILERISECGSFLLDRM